MEENGKVMRHSQQEILDAFNYLMSKDLSEEYQKNILLITEYIEDLVTVTETYKNTAEESVNLVNTLIEKIVKINMEESLEQSPKQRQITKLKKIKMINDLANKIDVLKKD